jgi:hypothetical protein
VNNNSIHKWLGTITLLSPLSHNSDETMGVDTKFRRIDMFTPERKRMSIPVYSGNAFRGILRRIAAKQYLEALGMYEFNKIDERLYYLFFSGGSLEKGTTQDFIEVGSDREFRELVPFMSIFGGARGNRIHGGKLKIGIAIPIAEETSEFTGIDSDKSVWELIDEIFYTRKDDIPEHLNIPGAEKNKPTDETERGDAGNSVQPQQMRYQIECLIPGTVLHHSISLQFPTEIELSCWGAVWNEFASNPVLGGMSGRGHGKVKLNYTPEFPDSGLYFEFLKDSKERILGAEVFKKCV